jgi:hypothetical protein
VFDAARDSRARSRRSGVGSGSHIQGSTGADLIVLCDPNLSVKCRAEELIGGAGEFAQLLAGLEGEHDPG